MFQLAGFYSNCELSGSPGLRKPRGCSNRGVGGYVSWDLHVVLRSSLAGISGGPHLFWAESAQTVDSRV